MPKKTIIVLNSSESWEKSVYATKGLIETQFASKGPPPTIDNSMDHVTRFESRYSSIYGCINFYSWDVFSVQFSLHGSQ